MAMEDGISYYTQDGTVDLKGNPILRSKRGRWKACSFIVGRCEDMNLRFEGGGDLSSLFEPSGRPVFNNADVGGGGVRTLFNEM